MKDNDYHAGREFNDDVLDLPLVPLAASSVRIIKLPSMSKDSCEGLTVTAALTNEEGDAHDESQASHDTCGDLGMSSVTYPSSSLSDLSNEHLCVWIRSSCSGDEEHNECGPLQHDCDGERLANAIKWIAALHCKVED